MGWSSGVLMAEEIWTHIERHIPEEYRHGIAIKIVNIFDLHDADGWGEDPGMYTKYVMSHEEHMDSIRELEELKDVIQYLKTHGFKI